VSRGGVASASCAGSLGWLICGRMALRMRVHFLWPANWSRDGRASPGTYDRNVAVCDWQPMISHRLRWSWLLASSLLIERRWRARSENLRHRNKITPLLYHLFIQTLMVSPTGKIRRFIESQRIRARSRSRCPRHVRTVASTTREATY
jgi:hypothetical protein